MPEYMTNEIPYEPIASLKIPIYLSDDSTYSIPYEYREEVLARLLLTGLILKMPDLTSLWGRYDFIDVSLRNNDWVIKVEEDRFTISVEHLKTIHEILKEMSCPNT